MFDDEVRRALRQFETELANLIAAVEALSRPARRRPPRRRARMGNLLAALGRREERSGGHRGGRRGLPRAGGGAARRLPPRPRRIAQQSGQHARRPRPARGRARGHRGGRRRLSRAGGGAARRLPTRPRRDRSTIWATGSTISAGARTALAATEEAVAIYRELAAARPDAFRPDLAATLNNLGNRLDALGRREEALAATEEAVGHPPRAGGGRPDAFRPDLAMALNNLGPCSTPSAGARTRSRPPRRPSPSAASWRRRGPTPSTQTSP